MNHVARKPTGDWQDNQNMVSVRLVTREGSPWHSSWHEVFPEDGSGELKIGQGVIVADKTAVVVSFILKRRGHWSAALAVASDFVDEWQISYPEGWAWDRYTDYERYR